MAWCASCKGTGRELGTEDACRHCGGRGHYDKRRFRLTMEFDADTHTEARRAVNWLRKADVADRFVVIKLENITPTLNKAREEA